MDRSFHEAPLFWVLFTGLIVLGAVVGLVIPHGAVVQVLLVVQVVNGVLLPVLLVFIIRLVNKRAVMGRYTKGRVYNAVAWTTVVAGAGLSVLERRRATLEIQHTRGVIPLDVPANRLTPEVINTYLDLKARGRV